MEPEPLFPTEKYELGRQDSPEGFNHRRSSQERTFVPRELRPLSLTQDTMGAPPQPKPDLAALSVCNRQGHSSITNAFSGKSLCSYGPESWITAQHQETPGKVNTAAWTTCPEKFLCLGSLTLPPTVRHLANLAGKPYLLPSIAPAWPVEAQEAPDKTSKPK